MILTQKKHKFQQIDNQKIVNLIKIKLCPLTEKSKVRPKQRPLMMHKQELQYEKVLKKEQKLFSISRVARKSHPLFKTNHEKPDQSDLLKRAKQHIRSKRMEAQFLGNVAKKESKYALDRYIQIMKQDSNKSKKDIEEDNQVSFYIPKKKFIFETLSSIEPGSTPIIDLSRNEINEEAEKERARRNHKKMVKISKQISQLERKLSVTD